ncbi:sterol desaturase family protein, partial [Xanthovirga aplysinae]|uniref:sterol desaturase family protein n=1 Tax=Xanthovirga aplysinae TaxID=2529853 RepID=UPI0012BB761D
VPYAIPFFLIFVLIEYLLSLRKKRESYHKKDFLAAVVIGLGSVAINSVFKFFNVAAFLLVYELVPWKLPSNVVSFFICFLTLDLCRYWAHRVSHFNRFWWASHVPHHSSRYLNLSVGFRLSWTQPLKIIFFLPVAFLGFNPLEILICHQIAVLYQFWIHTEYINRLPKWIEFIFVTPSHHRVHHGSNPRYLDKNFGSTFIIWDRIFGSFQPEKEKPIYGLTKNVNSYNPLFLVFHEWIDIIRDLKRSQSWNEAMKMLFGRPKG